MTFVRVAHTLVAVLILGITALHAQVTPAASVPVVFVHGNGDDAAKWIGIIWLFESNGYPADKLFALRILYPNSRNDDTRAEVNRSSTEDAAAELSAFVTRVLIETHSTQVALIGSSRGGLTIRNYLLHGGRANVAYAILCGTPNHGVIDSDANLNGEYNGKGNFLMALNHASADGSEVVAGVKMMTLRSDKLDKYAQSTGISFGAPQIQTHVSYEGPALRGAENVVLAGLDHRELAFQPRAFAEMYRFIVGAAPQRLTVVPEAHPTISGLVTGFDNGAFTNQPLSGAHLRIYPVDAKDATESNTPAYEITTTEDGRWGPFQADPNQEYDFDLEYGGRHVSYYKAPIPRSTTLLNLRFMPVPPVKNSAGVEKPSELLIERPQGYFSRDRDPVMIDGKVSASEASGLPIDDSFVVDIPTNQTALTRVILRNEIIAARPSKDFSKELPVVDFLW
ncbi:MAG: lipase [Granulicella sp.]